MTTAEELINSGLFVPPEPVVETTDMQNVVDFDSDKIDLVEAGVFTPPKKTDNYFNTLVNFYAGVGEELFGTKADASWMDYFEAGFQNSNVGLMARGKLPDVNLPEEGGLAKVAAMQAVTEVLDIPLTVAGAVGGGAAGAAAGTAVAPGIGTAIGTGVGTFGGALALPDVMREGLIQAYRQGGINSAGEFFDVVKEASIAGGQSLATGAVLGPAGKIAGKFVPDKFLSKPLGVAAKQASEFLGQTSAMTAMRGVFEGEVPDARDFVQNAVTMLAVRGAETSVMRGGAEAVKNVKNTTKTLQDVYVKKGVKPDVLVKEAEIDGSIAEDIIAGNSSIRRLADGEEGLQQAMDNVLSRVVPDVKQTADITAAKVYTAAVDSLHPVRKMINSLAAGIRDGKVLSPYEDLTMLRNSLGASLRFFYRSTADFTTKNAVGEPLFKVLKDAKGVEKELTTYIVSKRSLLLEGRGKKTGVDTVSAQRILDGASPKVRELADRLNTFNQTSLKYFYDAGMISKKDYDNIKGQNEFYVPFHRLFEESQKGGKEKVSKVLKAITEEGSERKIIDPISTSIKNAEAMITLAERNAAMKNFVDFGLKHDDEGKYLEKVTRYRKTKVRETDLQSLGDDVVDLVPKDMELDVFRVDYGALRDDEVAIHRDGKREVYRIKDPDVAEAIRSLDARQSSTLMKVLSVPARIKRVGITNSLTFGVRNFIRAELSSYINSPDNYIPLYDGLRGMMELGLAKAPDLSGKAPKAIVNYQKRLINAFDQWMTAGGGINTMIDIDNTYRRQGIDRLLRQAHRNHMGTSYKDNVARLGQLSIAAPKAALSGLEGAATFFENAPRFRQFQKSVKSGKDVRLAAYDSAEVATNFSKKGNSEFVNGMRQLSTFLGATVQSYDKLAREIATNPGKVTARATASIVLPSVALHLLNHYEVDEDGEMKLRSDYTDLAKYQRDLFWIINTGEHTIRIPKPYDYGAMYAVASESFVDFLVSNDPDAAKHLALALSENFIPDIGLLTPETALPFIEGGFNHSFFKDAPLVSRSMENSLSHLQYTDNTTEIAKGISYAIHKMYGETSKSILISPISVENFVQQWSGAIGMSVLRTVDDALKEAGVIEDATKSRATIFDVGKAALAEIGITEPNPDVPVNVMDIPILKSFFIRNPSLGAQPIADFYKNKTKIDTYKASISRMEKEEPATAVMLQMKASELGLDFDVDMFADSISKQMQLIKDIRKIPDETMSTAEKIQTTDMITKSVVLMAREANKAMEQYESYMNDYYKKREKYDKLKQEKN